MAPPAGKIRLDQWLVDQGLVETRTKAQAVIRAGEVVVGEQRIDKPGTLIPPGSQVRITSLHQDVSRGAAKLRGALDCFDFSIEGKLAADLGASTGGFTQVLLERGAKRVETFDVGYGLLHERLRQDPRVVIHDRVNVRHLTGSEMEPAEIVVMDLSFIGLDLVLPAAFRISAPSAEFVALVKPQFEAGRGSVSKGGIVRDEKVLQRVLETHVESLATHGFAAWRIVPSEVKGRKGNQEFFSWFRKAEHFVQPDSNWPVFPERAMPAGS
jgi:23S rRNA (cytidine1920-2'-O)/16S rRNA (cytidine1409-2'-O)-methyltransferase